MRALLMVLACLFLLAGCTVIDTNDGTSGEPKSNAEIVRIVLTRGLAGDEGVINKYVAEDYKQHNPMAEDGRAGLLGFVRSLKGVKVRIEIRRVLCDGDFVAVHSDAWFGDSHSAVFDLFIVRDGMLREHWDCIQQAGEKNASGRTMTDGATEVSDREKTEANRTLVKEFFDKVVSGGDQSNMTRYLDAHYAEHNPGMADGIEALKAMFEAMAKAGQSFKFTKLHRIIAEGNFVLTQCEGEMNGRRVAFYDLHRIENGKIVEHWDTMQEVPATSKNKNGMF